MRIPRNWAGFLGVLLLTVVLGPTALAENIYVLSDGDGYYHNESGSSYDYFDSSANSVLYCFWGDSDSLQQDTAYTQFNISSIAPGTDIVSATLNLYMTGSFIGTSTYAGYVKHRTDSSTATGSAAQRLGGDQTVLNVGAGLTGWLSMDITDYLQSDLDNSYGWSCFSYNYDSSGSYSDRYSGFSFGTAESGYAAFISYTTASSGGTSDVPEPATLGLLILGGLGLVCRRRRSA